MEDILVEIISVIALAYFGFKAKRQTKQTHDLLHSLKE